ncbi:hypothetical protein GCM10010421_55380 [Streptomyces glaucus]|uniref:Secreted protein n=1 Tax=Streptomyces glaucus TaxID=284029 RepID=A0ABN3KBV8_9ACTN
MKQSTSGPARPLAAPSTAHAQHGGTIRASDTARTAARLAAVAVIADARHADGGRSRSRGGPPLPAGRAAHGPRPSRSGSSGRHPAGRTPAGDTRVPHGAAGED